MLLSRRRSRYCCMLLPLILVPVVGLMTPATSPDHACWAQDHHATPPQVPTVKHGEAMAFPVVRVVKPRHMLVLMNGHETVVRLAGVAPHPYADDAPATAHTSEQPAMGFTRNLLKGERVWLEILPRDETSRADGSVPAHVFRTPDGLFVDAEVIRQGYGRAHWAADHRYAELLHDYEIRAREAGKGLWGPSARGGPSARAQAASNDAHHQKHIVPQIVVPQIVVYVVSSGTRYHSEGCPQLHDGQHDGQRDGQPIAMPVYKAMSGYEPCTACKPPR